jgi:hypothetical protein
MARRRISLWVEEEMYEDYKRLAAELTEVPSDLLRASLQAGLPGPDELERDYQLPRDFLRSGGGQVGGG